MMNIPGRSALPTANSRAALGTQEGRIGRLLAPPSAPSYSSGIGDLAVVAGVVGGFLLALLMAQTTRSGGAILAFPVGIVLGIIIGAVAGQVVESADRNRWYSSFREVVAE